MRLILIFILSITLGSCTKEETFNDVKPNSLVRHIEFRVTGLDTNVLKHIVIFCANGYVDTVVKGSYYKLITTNQSIVDARMTVKSSEPVWNNVSISCEGYDAIMKWSECDALGYEIKLLFKF